MCVVGVVLESSSILYGKKVSRLAVQKTNRLAQAVVFFPRHFLCGALLCNCSSAERGGLSTHTCTAVIFSRTLYLQHPVTKNLHISPRFSPTTFCRDANSVVNYNLVGSMRRTLCSNMFMMRA